MKSRLFQFHVWRGERKNLMRARMRRCTRLMNIFSLLGDFDFKSADTKGEETNGQWMEFWYSN